MKLSETQLYFTMSFTTPLLHWGSFFLLKKVSSLPPLALGFLFLVEEKFLGVIVRTSFLKICTS